MLAVRDEDDAITAACNYGELKLACTVYDVLFFIFQMCMEVKHMLYCRAIYEMLDYL